MNQNRFVRAMILSAGLLGCLAIPTLAGDREDPPAPTVLLTPAEIDVGILEPYEKKKIQFELRNASEGKLFITRLATGCACVEVEAPDKELEPGETVTIQGVVTAALSRGSRRLDVTVTTTDRSTPRVVSSVRFAVPPILTATPPTIDFGFVRAGSTVTKAVLIEAQVPEPMKTLEVESVLHSENSPLSLEVGELEWERVNPWVHEYRQQLQVTLDASKLRNREIQGRIEFRGEGFTSRPVAIKGLVHRDYKLQNPKIHFGIVRVGETKVKRFWIDYFDQKKPPEVLGVETDLEGLTVEPFVEHKESRFRLRLTYAPAAEGDFRGEVRLTTSFTESPIVIRTEAKARPPKKDG